VAARSAQRSSGRGLASGASVFFVSLQSSNVEELYSTNIEID
jgi:hypothetical protein